jgi:hypothetical protein
VESKNRETGGFDRQSVILFADDLQEFLKGFDESLRVLEKETRERRRSSRAPIRETKGGASQSDAMTGERNNKPDRGGKDDRKTGPKGPERPRKDRPPRNSKRIVVRKK